MIIPHSEFSDGSIPRVSDSAPENFEYFPETMWDMA
jgi:hypothetical protein